MGRWGGWCGEAAASGRRKGNEWGGYLPTLGRNHRGLVPHSRLLRSIKHTTSEYEYSTNTQWECKTLYVSAKRECKNNGGGERGRATPATIACSEGR